jgi:hypothetical protein
MKTDENQDGRVLSGRFILDGDAESGDPVLSDFHCLLQSSRSGAQG